MRYHYGNNHNQNGANSTGRVIVREDGSGAVEYDYDIYGNVTEELRTFVVPNNGMRTYLTKSKYCPFGRTLSVTYPDGEEVRYEYDLGGELKAVNGYRGQHVYPYAVDIFHDRFGQRTSRVLGDNSQTRYMYDASRRLERLTVEAYGGAIMDLEYYFDGVGNVKELKNNAQEGRLPALQHLYDYDEFDRLILATGTSEKCDNQYQLKMNYDDMHRIVSKAQFMTQKDIALPGRAETEYRLGYSYSGAHPFRMDKVTDFGIRSGAVGVDTTECVRSFRYDANGNLTYAATARVRAEGDTLQTIGERKLLWDEENRLEAVSDNGFVSCYWYDADGIRTVKTAGDNESVYVDGEYRAARTETSDFTLYVSPMFVRKGDGTYTKHYYAGGERIASKVATIWDEDNPCYADNLAGGDDTGVYKDYESLYAQQTASVIARYKALGVRYGGNDNGILPRNVAGKTGIASTDSAASGMTAGTDAYDASGISGNPALAETADDSEYEYECYFYHPDHLGSTSCVTDYGGNVVQHVEYVPYGEVFLEQRQGDWHTPYLFNAKEFDEETGLYYYGARYYDPRLSLWMSPDPLQEKYPSVSSYCYVIGNPVNLIDPDGKDVLIWYKDQDGKTRLFRFRGFGESKRILIPDNQYVKDFIDAYLYNAKNGGGEKTIQAVTNHKYKIYVSEHSEGETLYYGNTKQPTVYWNSRSGRKTSTGGRLSPATALEHEMDHAVDDADNPIQHQKRKNNKIPQYGNEEERRVITGSEAKTAKCNKESVRKDHIGTPYKTVSSTSTKEAK